MRATKDKVHILLVDDDREEYLLTQTMFSRMKGDYALEWAGSYDDALSRLRDDHHFDMFLIDYRLGQHTGLDLLREPEIADTDIPAILITNQADGDVDMIALEAGAADYLNKGSIDLRLLERTVRYALERAQTMQHLRQSEARYRGIVEDQTDMIVRFLPNGEITFVNGANERFRQLGGEQIIGTYYLECVVERDRKRLEVMTGDWATPATMTNEVRAVDYDGRERWQQWTTRPIVGDDGRVFEYQSVIRDVTERRQVEEALNARVDQLRILRSVDVELTETLKIEHVISLALDSAMRLGAADIAIMALYDGETDRLNIVQSYGVADMEHVQERFYNREGVIKKVVDTRRGVLIPDIAANPNTHATTERMKSMMIIPLISQESFLGVISLETRLPERFTEEIFDFIQLVTARIAVSIDNARLYDLLKTRLEELEQLYAQVSELEQLKTEIIRISAHDLNNPLGIMQGYIDIMEWNVANNQIDVVKFTDQFQAMKKALKRMKRITDDILTLERFERRQTEQEAVDLSLIIREVADEYSYSARDNHLTYELDIPRSPTYVMGDRTQLHEAAANLVNNAIKYTPAQGTVTIVLENDGDAAVFEVIDNGVGIPYEQQARLFQPFYRAQTKETKNIEGTGLGLHLVKGIVERHNGRMVFRSR
ncbi:MAG: ATP-binding protein, partial [Chloroflexota bacterium]